MSRSRRRVRYRRSVVRGPNWFADCYEAGGEKQDNKTIFSLPLLARSKNISFPHQRPYGLSAEAGRSALELKKDL